MFFQVVTFYLREGMTVEDFLAASCLKRSLDPVEHFVRVKKRRERAGADRDTGHNGSQKYFVPHRADLIETYVSAMYILLEGCSQVVLALHASGPSVTTLQGLSLCQV